MNAHKRINTHHIHVQTNHMHASELTRPVLQHSIQLLTHLHPHTERFAHSPHPLCSGHLRYMQTMNAHPQHRSSFCVLGQLAICAHGVMHTVTSPHTITPTTLCQHTITPTLHQEATGWQRIMSRIFQFFQALPPGTRKKIRLADQGYDHGKVHVGLPTGAGAVEDWSS